MDIFQLLVVQLLRDGDDAHPRERRDGAEVPQILEDLGRLARAGLRLARDQPGMRRGLAHGHAVLGVRLDEALDKVLGVRVHLVPRGRCHRIFFGQCFLDVLSLRTPEGWLAAQHDICQHSQAPQVALLRVRLELPRHDDLGRGVSEASNGRFHRGANEGHRQAPVYQLDAGVMRVSRAEHHVFWLYVAMRDAEGMRVAQGGRDLCDDVSCDGLGDLTALDDPVEHLPALAQLHDEEHAPAPLERREQLADVGVVQHLHCRDFVHECLVVSARLRVFRDLLHSDLPVLVLFVLCNEDLSVATLANLLLVEGVSFRNVYVEAFR
mmetsp:Transcript_90048/g.255189  ORF Transcript_90048/g.255189 Transcript_90048/m.255189 type:complete len:323 (+) Transcript_90048:705-1673(+)